MICLRLVCTTVLCLAATALQAQGHGAGNPSPRPAPAQQQDSPQAISPAQTPQRAQGADATYVDSVKLRDWNPNLGWDSNVGKRRPDQVWSISEARENLAKEWQRLGIPPDQATVIASAYQARTARRHSLRGESRQRIASMLQDALKSKDYRLANQLLIDYERSNLQLESDR